MAIELKLCKCGCGKSKLGTKRLEFYSNTCRQRYFRMKSIKKEVIDD